MSLLCNFLGDHGVKPKKVLKKAGLEGADWEDPDSVHLLYKASTKFLPRTLRSNSDADSDADASGDLSPLETVFFSFLPASYVEGLSLTASLRYQDSRLEIS
jgi:hypothetical protein